MTSDGARPRRIPEIAELLPRPVLTELVGPAMKATARVRCGPDTVRTELVEEKEDSSSAIRTSATCCTAPRRFPHLTKSLPQC